MPPEDPNVPFLERPEMYDKPEGSGLFCFIDSARPCSAECMAYLETRPDGPDYVEQQWAKCSLLVNTHRAGKHLVVLASAADALLKHLRIKHADASRASQPMPPPVK